VFNLTCSFAILCISTEGLYWTNYWQRYRPLPDNDDSYDDYDDNYYDYDSEEQIVIRPSFVQTRRNVSVHRGDTARLCCLVQDLGSKTVCLFIYLFTYLKLFTCGEKQQENRMLSIAEYAVLTKQSYKVEIQKNQHDAIT